MTGVVGGKLFQWLKAGFLLDYIECGLYSPSFQRFKSRRTPLRILIVTTFFPPLNSIASLRPYSWAKFWTQTGHDVTVLTIEKEESDIQLNVNNPGYKVIETAQPRLMKKLKSSYKSSPGNNAGVVNSAAAFKSWIKAPFIGLFDWLRYKRGIFNACRMPDFTDLWIRPAVDAAAGLGKFDVVVSTAGPYSVHIVAHKIKQKGLAVKWVADYRDTWSDNYIYPGLFPFNRIEKVLEGRMLQSADLITTVSDPFADSFLNKYPLKRVHTIENGFDPADLEIASPLPAFPPDGKFRIVHTGSIYLGKRDPSPLFEAIANLSGDQGNNQLLDKLEVLFVGPRQANLEELIKQYRVDKWVKAPGFFSREQALAMQRDAHALLFLPWNDLSVDGVLTGKIFEYLFSGTPIMCVGGKGLEASQQLVLDAKAGEVFDDVKDIEKFLVQKLSLVEKENSQVDPEFLKRYDRRHLAERLLQLMKMD